MLHLVLDYGNEGGYTFKFFLSCLEFLKLNVLRNTDTAEEDVITDEYNKTKSELNNLKLILERQDVAGLGKVTFSFCIWKGFPYKVLHHFPPHYHLHSHHYERPFYSLLGCPQT